MVLEQRTYSEKRNFIRMKINAPVDIKAGNEQFTARCKDLSGSGILIQTDRALALGTSVEVCIQQEGDKLVPFRATGEVVRVDPVNPSGFILGLSLSAIHD
ncbi:MAG TPA: PilZ domain-containing protein [Spongiibacteraceae bacterium]|nr:PilZ domain-containing protein [Spongiibacteraceae bacterium]